MWGIGYKILQSGSIHWPTRTAAHRYTDLHNLQVQVPSKMLHCITLNCVYWTHCLSIKQALSNSLQKSNIRHAILNSLYKFRAVSINQNTDPAWPTGQRLHVTRLNVLRPTFVPKNSGACHSSKAHSTWVHESVSWVRISSAFTDLHTFYSDTHSSSNMPNLQQT
jgi:hypothetical protein